MGKKGALNQCFRDTFHATAKCVGILATYSRTARVSTAMTNFSQVMLVTKNRKFIKAGKRGAKWTAPVADHKYDQAALDRHTGRRSRPRSPVSAQGGIPRSRWLEEEEGIMSGMNIEWEEIESWEGDPNLCRVCGPNDPGNCRGAICLPPGCAPGEGIIVKNGRVIPLVRAEHGRMILLVSAEKESETAQKQEHSILKRSLPELSHAEFEKV
jgi:hypothetical protein